MTIKIEVADNTASYTQGEGWQSTDLTFQTLLTAIDAYEQLETFAYEPNPELAAVERIHKHYPDLLIISSVVTPVADPQKIY